LKKSSHQNYLLLALHRLSNRPLLPLRQWEALLLNHHYKLYYPVFRLVEQQALAQELLFGGSYATA
jgi:hypothetical protein